MKSLSKDKYNYKFINFKKASDDLKIENDAGKQNEKFAEKSKPSTAASEFYLSVIMNSDYKKAEDENDSKFKKEEYAAKNISSKTNKLKNSVSHLNKREYLKAAQTNNLKYIKDYLNQNLTLNEFDDYKWNALMIAIASSNNEIVKYLLETQTNKTDFNDMINFSDSSGNTPESLALRFNNKEAFDLIKNVKKYVNKPEIIKNEQNSNEKQKYFCEICCQNCDSYKDHIKSITHQLNEKQLKYNNLDENKLVKKANYFLRPSNKGYQLLVKSGWNEFSGLGANEQGNTRPIRTRIKLDRLGIGIPEDDKDSKKVCRRNCNLNLKQENKKAGERIEDQFKRNKEIKKAKSKHIKSKNFERNLRLMFNE